jgi:hypothetical protein
MKRTKYRIVQFPTKLERCIVRTNWLLPVSQATPSLERRVWYFVLDQAQRVLWISLIINSTQCTTVNQHPPIIGNKPHYCKVPPFQRGCGLRDYSYQAPPQDHLHWVMERANLHSAPANLGHNNTMPRAVEIYLRPRLVRSIGTMKSANDPRPQTPAHILNLQREHTMYQLQYSAANEINSAQTTPT